jgi:hypothetical protein
MDNASKNAGEMIQKFSLLYNRCAPNGAMLIIEPVKLSSLLNWLISLRVPAQFRLVVYNRFN